MIVVIYLVYIPDVSGHQVIFPTIDFRFGSTPVYCGIEPDLPYISKGIVDMLMKQAQTSVSEWKTMLENADSEHRERWDIKYVQIPVGQQYDPTKCDVQIIFEDKPVAKDAFVYWGYFDRSIIKIFYLEIETCQGLDYIYYCYKDDVIRTSEGIATTLRHEIGHTLGLGHYPADDDQVNLAWSQGTLEPPSIMVPIPVVNQLRTIKEVDVQKVREIYGINGFSTFSDLQKGSDVLIEDSGPILAVHAKLIDKTSQKENKKLDKQTEKISSDSKYSTCGKYTNDSKKFAVCKSAIDKKSR